MTPKRTSWWLLAIPIVVLACGSSNSAGKQSPGGDAGSSEEGGAGEGGALEEGGMTGGDGSSPSGNNVAPLVVDNGPAGAGGSVDVSFISVTLCIPGTTTCQTIDHVSVDTGSSGLRILASELPSGFTLPQPNATTGSPLGECFTFDDGFTWGSVRSADVKIAGEIAAKIPLQLIDPNYATVPSDCSSTGSPENTLADFGAKGIIGINQIIPDCGSYCADTTVQPGGYYSCTGTTCADVAVAISAQVSNPIAFFASDSNGAVLEFPAIPATGAKTLAGSLIFGIGTASNNALGSASVQTVDEYGNFTTIFNGQTLTTSYIDSGTNSLSFNDSAIAQCSDGSGYFCPTSTVNLTAENKGLNGVTAMVSFSVANTDTLFGNGSDTAFDDLATVYGTSDSTTFAWGFPFFIGRNVYIGLDGAMTTGGKGPYVAY